jgi:hypothetical protein
MNVREIVIQYLRQNGFGGLYCPGECGCTIDDLAPCGEMVEACESGVKEPCTCGEGCDWDMGPKELAE